MRNLIIRDYKVVGVSPVNLLSVSVSANITVQNDTIPFSMSNIRGAVQKKGKAIIEGQVTDIFLESGVNTIYVRGKLNIAKGQTLFSILKLFKNYRNSEYEYSVSMMVNLSSGETKYVIKEALCFDDVRHDNE